MTYRIEVTPTAERGLTALPRTVRNRLDKRILALSEDPRPSGSKLLKGRLKGFLRIRVGDSRIICSVEDDRLLVLVVRVANRREAYR